MRSAWLKWARGVEHGKELARSTREYVTTHQRYEYVRFDNEQDRSDPLVRMHWTARVKNPYPERWSMLLADLVGNLRAALDHSFWQACLTQTGTPVKPTIVAFPICLTEDAFARRSGDLRQLVSSQAWDVVSALQPFRGGSAAATDPLAVLQWLSNIDKHRSVHVASTAFVDLGPALLASPVALEIVEEWVKDGRVDDGDVVARLKFRRPPAALPVDISPVFAHTPVIQISDDPDDVRALRGAVNVVQERTFEAVAAIAAVLGFEVPAVDSLDVGARHDEVLPEHGGDLLILSGGDETRTIHPLLKTRSDDGSAHS